MASGVPLALLQRVLLGEGWRGATARALDRLASRRRARRFPTIPAERLPGADLPSSLAAALGDAANKVLNVLSTEPRPDLGGVQTQVALRLTAELRHRPVAVLYPERGGLGGHRLEVDTASDRTGRLAVIFPPVEGFDTVLQRSLELCRCDIVHVEQPLGLPWDAIRSIPGTDRSLVLSLHDFGLFCARPHLLERPQMTFCDFCRDDARCTACLGHDFDVSPGHQRMRRREAAGLLEAADAVVFPSAYLRETYVRLFESLKQPQLHVVPPPSVLHTAKGPSGSDRRSQRPKRIAFVGSFKPHKGSNVFLDLLDSLDDLDHEPPVQWHVLGGGDADALAALRARSNVTVHGYYRSGQLPRRLRDLSIDLALVLSIWPETYCMAVDESLRASVPVLAFDHGAPGERLRQLGGGLLVDPADGAGGGADGVAATVRALLDGRRDLPSVDHASSLPDAVEAADRMLTVYRSLAADADSPDDELEDEPSDELKTLS